MTGTDAAPVPCPSVRLPSTRYPSAQRQDGIDHLHGHPVADPYRRLENPADPRTVTWTTEQDRLTHETLHALPGRTALARKLERLMSTGWVSAPVWRNGRVFFTRRELTGSTPCCTSEKPDRTAR